jgi:hypothetical protein
VTSIAKNIAASKTQEPYGEENQIEWQADRAGGGKSTWREAELREKAKRN